MEQNPYSEANSHSGSKETFRYLWNPKVRYRFQKSPPLVTILSRCIQSEPSRPRPFYVIL